MGIITFDDKLKTGNRAIDADHIQLIEIVNTLTTAMQEGKGKRERCMWLCSESFD